ncbi:MAG: tRNA pseudouridine(55) synthase TruB [Gammaproteobacteria bacterium]|nr:tRNA pseudouridine(55) synthase TruB [Gammaproteobacteria bacterium]NNL64039.1 tRNA pseudouridine(55) synthase TruB [Woeseiaceae bacterium]
MGRGGRRRYDEVDGILLLDKPPGITSNRALQAVRRLLNARKAGHTGSLDPSATGMLPLCFGEATKVCAFLLNADKTYRVTARLGTATSTGDADGGETIATADVPALSFDQWNEILQGFKGESMQVPPMYSALKKDGKRLYELARKGETVEREPRPIRIDEICLLEAAGLRLVFRVTCSKGTYVRVLVEDIAKQAGTVAHTLRLHRESVGHFKADDMVGLATLEERAASDLAELRDSLLAPDAALTGLPAVEVGPGDGCRFVAGQAIGAAGSDAHGLVRVYAEGTGFLGVGEVSPDSELAPRRVFRTSEKTP